MVLEINRLIFGKDKTMTPTPPLKKEVPIHSPGQAKIIQACEKHWHAHQSNCSGFVNAVADQLAIPLPHVQANPMIDYIASWKTPSWWKINTPAEAGSYSEKGYFVLACLKNTSHGRASHGHVVVITSGHEPAHGIYPRGYWGMYGGVGKMNSTINYTFDMSFLPRQVTYFRYMRVL